MTIWKIAIHSVTADVLGCSWLLHLWKV